MHSHSSLFVNRRKRWSYVGIAYRLISKLSFHQRSGSGYVRANLEVRMFELRLQVKILSTSGPRPRCHPIGYQSIFRPLSRNP